ncbi:MAG: hypothetical protein AAF242_12900, partial [Bacteroidota bacterium]
MNSLKSIVLLGMLLVFSAGIYAQGQRGPRGPRGGEDRDPLQMLTKVLELSEEQVAQLTPIFEDTKEQMQALRDQEFDSREARMEAAKEIMDAQHEAVKEVLTEDQVTKLEEIKAKRGERGPRGPRGQRGAGIDKEDRAALQQELKAYHSENIQPVILAQRAKLEEELSAVDKATLEELRAQRAAAMATRKAAKEAGERPAPPTEEQKAQHKATMETLKGIAERYADDIEDLFAEIQPDAEEWKSDLKEIATKYRSEEAAPGAREGRGKGQRGGRGFQKGREGGPRHPGSFHDMKGPRGKAHFLLLDPNAEEANETFQESGVELEAFPNPAVSNTRINYTVNEAGVINIVLRNKTGNISQVLFNGYRQ